MIQPVVLTPDELTQVLSRIAPNGKEYGAARICRLLSQKHSVQTVEINSVCSVGNISDLVNKAINPRIRDLRLYVACVKPPVPIYNKFNQPSGMHFWSFYRDCAANDPAYQLEPLKGALGADLSALRDQPPQGYAQGFTGASASVQKAAKGADHASY